MPQSADSATGGLRRPRLARWRPVCPECGYSLRRLTSDRCPECGEAFPTPSRVYRRWANRRLPWERRVRGGVVFAYLRTILLIIFRPGRAARGVAIPDRYGKAVRWAVLHLVLLALVGSVCVSQTYFRDRALTPFLQMSGFFETVEPSTGDLLVWTTESMAMWMVALGSLPLLGAALGIAMPGHHPAARRAIVKWSLYSFGGVSLGLGIMIVVGLLTWSIWLMSQLGIIRPGLGSWAGFLAGRPEPPWLVVWAALYGFWWAVGAAGNPYLRRRGATVFLAHALTYIAAWLLLAKLLFNPGGLRELL